MHDPTLHLPNGSNGDRTTVLYRIVVLALILMNGVMNYIQIGDECVVQPNNEDAVFEVVVRLAGSDVALASGFQTASGKLDVVLGLVTPDTASSVAAILTRVAGFFRDGRNFEDWDAVYVEGSSKNESGTLPF